MRKTKLPGRFSCATCGIGLDLPCKHWVASYEEHIVGLNRSRANSVAMVEVLSHALERSNDRIELIANDYRRTVIERDEARKADAALQSYVSSFDALRTNLLQILDSHALLTRSQVVERIRELLQ
jgi:hypothetical protein